MVDLDDLENVLIVDGRLQVHGRHISLDMTEGRRIIQFCPSHSKRSP